MSNNYSFEFDPIYSTGYITGRGISKENVADAIETWAIHTRAGAEFVWDKISGNNKTPDTGIAKVPYKRAYVEMQVHFSAKKNPLRITVTATDITKNSNKYEKQSKHTFINCAHSLEKFLTGEEHEQIENNENNANNSWNGGKHRKRHTMYRKRHTRRRMSRRK